MGLSTSGRMFRNASQKSTTIGSSVVWVMISSACRQNWESFANIQTSKEKRENLSIYYYYIPLHHLTSFNHTGKSKWIWKDLKGICRCENYRWYSMDFDGILSQIYVGPGSKMNLPRPCEARIRKGPACPANNHLTATQLHVWPCMERLLRWAMFWVRWVVKFMAILSEAIFPASEWKASELFIECMKWFWLEMIKATTVANYNL